MDSNEQPVVLEEIGRRLDLVSISLAELQTRFEPVSMTGDALVVVPNRFADTTTQATLDQTPDKNKRVVTREIGTTGQSVWTGMVREDYNPELRGKQGLLVYDKMRKGDGQVRGVVRVVKIPMLAARWYIEPASQKSADKKIAEFIWDNLTKWMTSSWTELLNEILLMLDYGYYTFEKVFEVVEDQVRWRKFAARHPLDVMRWEFDEHGGPKGAWYQGLNPAYEEYFVPMWKMALFTFDKEAGDVTGTSVLRPAYKHWFIKENMYKIDAIQKERHGIGIPVIKLPPNFDESDRKLADEMGRNLRTNEKAHIVLPPMWDIMMLKLEGNMVNPIATAEHHNEQIGQSVLAQFLQPSASASGSTQENMQQLFLKAIRYVADIVRDVINKYCIPQIVNWNWGPDVEYPELRVRRIGDTVDWRTISFAIRNFVGAGIIRPDQPLEDWLRNEMDLPAADESTSRVIVPNQQEGTIPDGQPDSRPGSGGPGAGAAHATGGVGARPSGVPKQQGQQAWLPRQSSAPGMQGQAQSPGGKQSGRDVSGKK